MTVKTQAIRGLDSLRFVAAACVALSHGASFPLESYASGASGITKIAVAAYNNAFNGPAAVIVFFLISGLVIHYPQSQGVPFDARAFLIRRIVRVAAPLLAACAIARLIGPEILDGLKLVLWSLYCELIYYVLYPILRLVFARWGLKICIAAAFAASILLILWGRQEYHWQYPLYLQWLVPFPAWLMGCLLAETAMASDKKPAQAIWLWRLAVWVYAWAASILFYHGGVKLGHPALLTPFCVLVFFWLRQEIRHFRSHDPVRVFEWAGTWSYSLYLIHIVVITAMPLPASDPALAWAARLALIGLASFGFFLVVERPSHKLARRLSRLGRAKAS